MSRNVRFKLSWKFPAGEGAVLTFNRTAWKLLQSIATPQGVSADELVSFEIEKPAGKISGYRFRQ